MYKKPTNVFQQKLKEVVKKEDTILIEELLRLFLYKNAEKDEGLLVLVELYNLLGLEKFTQVIELINGRNIKFPKKSEFKDNITQVLCYYYKNIENKTWPEIKEILGDSDLKTIKFGINIQKFQNFIKVISEKIKIKGSSK